MAAENKDKKKQPRYLALTGIALQMGITIYLFAALGKYIDKEYFAEKRYFTIILTFLGIALSFYNLLKQINRLNNKEDDERNTKV